MVGLEHFAFRQDRMVSIISHVERIRITIELCRYLLVLFINKIILCFCFLLNSISNGPFFSYTKFLNKK